MANQREKNQAHLAKMKAQDEVWARQFGRPSKYDETLSEIADTGQQVSGGVSVYGDRSAFRQVTNATGVLGVTK